MEHQIEVDGRIAAMVVLKVTRMQTAMISVSRKKYTMKKVAAW